MCTFSMKNFETLTHAIWDIGSYNFVFVLPRHSRLLHKSLFHAIDTTSQCSFWDFLAEKKRNVMFPQPTTKTPHALICSIYVAMRWLQWGWSQWLPFVQYDSSGEPNYNWVYLYPNQWTLHFGSSERKTFPTYDRGSFGPPHWASKGSAEGISVGVVAVTVAISIAVAVFVAAATVTAGVVHVRVGQKLV